MSLTYIVISTKDRKDQLDKCIQSVAAVCDYNTVWPVILDASTTISNKKILDNFKCSYHKAPADGNQSLALNNFLTNKQWDRFLWLSDDNELVPAVFFSVIKEMEKNPKLGLVGLKVKDLIGPYSNRAYLGSVSNKGILTCNQGLVSKQAFFDVGGFSEKQFPFFLLDTDISTKIIIAGYTIALSREIGVLHYRRVNETKSAINKRLNQYTLSRNTYSKKYYFLPEWHYRRSVCATLFMVLFGLGKLLNIILPNRTESELFRDALNYLKGRYTNKREFFKRKSALYLSQKLK